MIYLGVKGNLNLPHHSLFLDSDWPKHFQGIKNQKSVTNPLFYVSCPSKSDSSVAPKNHHNLFILIPQAAYVKQTSKEKDLVVKNVFKRINKFASTNIADKIVYQEIKDIDYFRDTFFAQGGNAFGLAHTLKQSSIFRPPIKHRSKPGLYFTGQFTNPGTGVPLAVISAQVVTDRIKKDYA